MTGMNYFAVLVALSYFPIQIVVVCVYRLTFHPLAKYPGPFLAKVSDFYGAYHSAKGQLHIKTEQNHRKWGSVVRQGPNSLVFNSKKAYEDIYLSKNVQKSKGYIPMAPIKGFFNIHNAIDKSLHKFKRKVIGQGLSDQSVRAFEPTMLNLVNTFIKNIAEPLMQNKSNNEWSEPINMTPRCRYLAYDAMSAFAFGQSLEMQKKPDNRFILDTVESVSIRSGVYQQYPEIAKYKLEQYLFPKGATMLRRFAEVTTKLVKQRLTVDNDGQNDLFSFIVDAKDPDTGRKFALDEIWSEGRFLLVAGSDTSATTLVATFFYLCKNPTYYEKLVSEIRSVFTSASEIRRGPKLSQCTYLRACVDETLRISPPAGEPLWREVCVGGVTVDNHCVPAGCDVASSIYAVHHNEDHYTNSHTYNPQRWIPSSGGNSKESVAGARSAFFPFSIGTRNCAGKTIADLEISVALARTLWYLDFQGAGGLEAKVGEGIRGGEGGRGVVEEFQIWMHLTSTHNGPYVQFKPRKEVMGELFGV